MKLKTCEYCGTEYKKDQEKCPLCGKGEAEALECSKMDVTPQEERIPKWMWILTCVLLGLAVVIGFVYFLVSMEYIGKNDHVEPTISVPVVEEIVEEAPVEVEPEDLSCKALTLSQTELILDELGGHVFLTAIPEPEGCEDKIVFVSMDEDIATVDESGMITAVAPGETEVMVACGRIVVECKVYCEFEVEETEEEEEPTEEEEVVEEIPEEEEPDQLPAPELSTVDFTLFRPGEETVLKVKNAPDDAVITYKTSDSSVATVSDEGKVVAVGSGAATITVTVDDMVLTCVARCNLAETTENNDETVIDPANLKLSHVDASLFSQGESFVLSLTNDGAKVSGASFSSANTAVCSVDANGLVTAVGSGTTTISVTYGGNTYSCIVRCNY